MALAAGTPLGPYEILSPLGAGGMGEVYRARDRKLDRDVAIKILPEALAADPDRIARFEREAKTLAALNHPNIAHIHGLEESDGARALVMELVEGPTLADRIAQRPIAIDEALPIARQIAQALEAAHDQGIIHRDLKPANVKLRPDGTVKVLDFGLAKVFESGPAGPASATMSPTLSMHATQAGLILGTAAYMSPEQAAGKPVDKRADIWAFGVVLWEMLAGRRLFDGETVAHTLADVLRADVDFHHLPEIAPPRIRELLRRCLDRDVRTRLRDIGEARIAIEQCVSSAKSEPPIRSQAVAARRSFSLPLAWSTAAVATVIAAAFAWVHLRESAPTADLIRFQMAPPEQSAFANSVVVSPDGRKVAFETLGADGRPILWIRSLDSFDARPLAGTEGVSPGPFWSPDSRYLAFAINGFPGRLKKVDASGGPPQTLCEYTGGFREGSWSLHGVIVFGTTIGLLSVADGGGAPSQLTKIDATRGEIQHAGPAFLPDGRTFVYHRGSRAPENRGLYIGSIDRKPEEQNLNRLIATDSDAVYTPPAHGRAAYLLYLRERTLLAHSFDGRSALTGDPVPIAENVGSTGSYGWHSASDNGALVYVAGQSAAAMSELTWFDRQGRPVGRLWTPGEYIGTGVQLSPDGRRVVVSRAEALATGAVGTVQGTLLWTAELNRGIFSRLTSGQTTEGGGAFADDGHVAFTSSANGAVGDVFWIHAGGASPPEPLLQKSPTVKHPNDFSPDGKFLIFDDHTAQRQDLWILPIDTRKPVPFLATQYDETCGQFSPDGRWIAYSSDENGRREVFVQGFAADRVPATAFGKWQISSAGGDKPRWSRDGRELYYLAPDRKLMAVPVKLGTTFEPGVGAPLFEIRGVGFFPYAVSPDGRFLVNALRENSGTTTASATIVLNWQTGLK